MYLIPYDIRVAFGGCKKTDFIYNYTARRLTGDVRGPRESGGDVAEANVIIN